MISSTFQWISIIAVCLYFVVLILLLKQKRLSLKYSLLWLLSGLLLLLLAVFPGILDWFADLTGVYSSVNALFAVFFLCVFGLMISITSIVSHQKTRLVRLAQEIALLEKRVSDLERSAEEKQV